MDRVQVYLESGEQIDLPESTPQTALRSVQPFLHSSPQRVPIHFTMGRPFPSQNCPSA